MLPEQRYKRILQKIEEKGYVKIQEIVDEFKVSEITARRDLDFLGKVNKVNRVRGGAKASDSEYQVSKDLNQQYSLRVEKNQNNKKQIGEYAAELIQDGDIIILDAGTTTLEIARHLHGKRDVTVIVTAVNTAIELEGREGITTIMTGGTLRSITTSLVNPLMKQTLSQIYADKVFIGVRGISASHGFTTDDFAEAEVKKLLLRSAKNVYIVADSSKFTYIAAAQIGHIDEAHAIITDSEVSNEVKRLFASFNCEIKESKEGDEKAFL